MKQDVINHPSLFFHVLFEIKWAFSPFQPEASTEDEPAFAVGVNGSAWPGVLLWFYNSLHASGFSGDFGAWLKGLLHFEGGWSGLAHSQGSSSSWRCWMRLRSGRLHGPDLACVHTLAHILHVLTLIFPFTGAKGPWRVTNWHVYDRVYVNQMLREKGLKICRPKELLHVGGFPSTVRLVGMKTRSDALCSLFTSSSPDGQKFILCEWSSGSSPPCVWIEMPLSGNALSWSNLPLHKRRLCQYSRDCPALPLHQNTTLHLL